MLSRPVPPRWTTSLALFALVASFTGCGEQDAPRPARASAAGERILTLPDGASVILPERPERVLPANSSVFDILVDVVARDRIAAIPAPAFHWSPLPGGPDAWRDHPLLERFEGELVLALDPDLLIVSSWSDRAAIAAAESAGIPVVSLDYAGSWESIVEAVMLIGEAVGEQTRAMEVVADLEARRKSLAADGRPALRVLPYSNFGAGGTTAGADTSVDLVIRLAGLVNAAAESGLTRHPQIDLEQVITMNPDVFMTASGRDGVLPGRDFLLGETVLANLEAIERGHIVVLSADLYSTASHRVLDAAEELARQVDALLAAEEESQ